MTGSDTNKALFAYAKSWLSHAHFSFASPTISDDLDWGQHISEISSKATKTLGFLRRNLAFAPRHTKEVAYKTLVRPKLEYAAPIWHPYHETQIGQVEKVQRTAARWTCRRWRNTSSVGDMLYDLEWPSLETRREQSSFCALSVVKRLCGIDQLQHGVEMGKSARKKKLKRKTTSWQVNGRLPGFHAPTSIYSFRSYKIFFLFVVSVSRFTETDRNGPKRTGTDRNGPERTETDFHGYRNGLSEYRNGLSGNRNGPKRTGTDRNGLSWIPKRTL